MDQNEVKINNLKSLLDEAIAETELTKLAEETSVDAVEGVEMPEGVAHEEPQEVSPEVETDDVVKTVESSEDVEGIKNEDLAEECSVDGVEGVKLPEGVLERKPEEGNPEVENDDVLDTIASSEDVEGIENKDLAEECSVDEVEGVKLPEGILEKKPEEENPDVDTEDVIDTVASSEDVEGIKNEDLAEECSVDGVEGVKLPEGVLERKPEEENPEVENDDVIDTVASSEDVEGIENEDLAEECSVDKVEGVKLPEGVLERKPEEENPEVENDDVIDTVDSAEDVEGIENDKLEESIARLNSFIDSLREETSVDEVEGVKLPEGVLERKPEEDNPEVENDDVIDTVDSAEDVEGIDNEDSGKEISGIGKPAGYKKLNHAENTPGEVTGIKSVDGTTYNDEVEYHNLKEAIKLGASYFNTEAKRKSLQESLAIMLAKENDDLLYEELVRVESQAKALREHISKKYSVISGNRVDNLLESMMSVEEKLAENRNKMFKKLHEQQEINAVEGSARTLSEDEVAFQKKTQLSESVTEERATDRKNETLKMSKAIKNASAILSAAGLVTAAVGGIKGIKANNAAKEIEASKPNEVKIGEEIGNTKKLEADVAEKQSVYDTANTNAEAAAKHTTDDNGNMTITRNKDADSARDTAKADLDSAKGKITKSSADQQKEFDDAKAEYNKKKAESDKNISTAKTLKTAGLTTAVAGLGGVGASHALNAKMKSRNKDIIENKIIELERQKASETDQAKQDKIQAEIDTLKKY